MPKWPASVLLRGLALANVLLLLLPVSVGSSALLANDATRVASTQSSPAFLASISTLRPPAAAVASGANAAAAALPAKPDPVPCFLMKKADGAPCPCLTTPAPLVDIRSAEVAHVVMAIQAAQKQGEDEIRAAVAGAGAPWAAQMRDTANPVVLDQRVGPQLRNLEQQQEQATNASFKSEEERQGQVRQELVVAAAREEAFGKEAIAKAAGTYAKMKAENRIANTSAAAITQTFEEERKVEAFKLEAEEFKQATLTAAQESLAVAREAEAAAAKAPASEMANARAFITTMEEQALTLQDEAAKADALSKRSELVAREANTIATGDLVTAKHSEALAMQTLAAAQENARRLSALHNDAQASEMKVGKIEY